MDPFSSTLLATATGALVGAAGSWLLSRELRWSAARQSQKREVDLAVSRVISACGNWRGAADAFVFASTLQSPAIQAAPPHGARAVAIAETRAAMLAASKGERAPLLAALEHFEAKGELRDDVVNSALMDWRLGSASADGAATRISGASSVPKRS